jgi:asparagine synthetase B (glutamine-hydrolysing)
MAMRLRHRGPDISGSHALPGCVLANARLRTVLGMWLEAHAGSAALAPVGSLT